MDSAMLAAVSCLPIPPAHMEQTMPTAPGIYLGAGGSELGFSRLRGNLSHLPSPMSLFPNPVLSYGAVCSGIILSAYGSLMVNF